MDLIIPICGMSTRYPGETPKWALKRYNNSMLELSVIGISGYNKLYIIYLKKHRSLIKDSAPKNANLIEIKEQTLNQCETVYKGLSVINSDSFVVKDCDNKFECNISEIKENFVGYYPLQKMNWVNVANKSYLEIQKDLYLERMVEKQIISTNFGVGLYGFQDRSEFCKEYLKNGKHEYLSSIVNEINHSGRKVKCIEVKNYIDWGTIHDWNWHWK